MMTNEIPDLFLEYLRQKFAQPVMVGDSATDVMRQPLFPGLEAKPRELRAPALPSLPPEVTAPTPPPEGGFGGFVDGPDY